jgi:hypothetical protein
MESYVLQSNLCSPKKGASFAFGTPKNGKGRTLTPAPFVMEILKNTRKSNPFIACKSGLHGMTKDFLIWYLRSLVEIISVSGQFVVFYKKAGRCRD